MLQFLEVEEATKQNVRLAVASGDRRGKSSLSVASTLHKRMLLTTFKTCSMAFGFVAVFYHDAELNPCFLRSRRSTLAAQSITL